MSIEPGIYIIRPIDSPDDALLVGPVPLIFPPPDVPLKVGGRPIDRWILRAADNNTFTVFTGRGRSNDYKWIVQNNALFVSSVKPPDSFRFESAGNNSWTIGIFGEDSLATLGDENESPRLTFKPADGSPAQRFELIQIDRE